MYLKIEKVQEYTQYLYEEERSEATINKYIRDIKKLMVYINGEMITKDKIVSFKQELVKTYKISSVNSILVAINRFLDYIGLSNCKVRLLKMQKRIFTSQEKLLSKEEYVRLVKVAKNKKNQRLYVLLQTICGTGIRVSELKYISVEAIKEGKAVVNNKGKIREVYFSKQLKLLLLSYCKSCHIKQGAIFITKNGKHLDRSNIWSSMKALCKDAQIDERKVFPHNLRHLFAFTFYNIEKDLVRLADLLGHSTVETTRIYTKTSGNEFGKVLGRLNLVEFHI